MEEGEEFRELMLEVFRTRMAFRRAMQRTLRKNHAGITFEMLQVLCSLWYEQGITQQVLSERIAKDKACLTNLMNNLEKKRVRMPQRRPYRPTKQVGFSYAERRKNLKKTFVPYSDKCTKKQNIL